MKQIFNTFDSIERYRVEQILGAWNLEKTAIFIESIKLVEENDTYTLFFRYYTGASFFKEIDCEQIPYEFQDMMLEDTNSWVLKVK